MNMTLNHLSLSVADVTVTAAFMQRYFNFRPVSMKGDKIAVLNNADGFVLVLSTSREGDPPYPADFHFGYLLGNTAAVDTLYETLAAAGHDMPRPPARIRNSYGFYFRIPGGIMAEISCTL